MKTKKLRRNGEDYLGSVAAITLELEDQQSVTFSLASESRIPKDPKAILEAARKAPARLSFWAYQTERALKALRAAETVAERTEAEWYKRYRKWREQEDAHHPTERNIGADITLDRECARARIRRDQAKYHYGIIRSLKEVAEHRLYVLRKLLDQHSPLNPGH